MKTLYDILDVHPDDDAGRIKDAFRKAVKANHPDLNVTDPDAPMRFVEIVRAKAILSNPELRAAYDRMLEFERQRLRPTSKLSVTHISDAIVVVLLAVVLAAAYTLFPYISDKTVTKTKAVAAATHEPANVVAARAPPPIDAATSESPRDSLEGAEAPVPSAVALTATGNIVEPIPSNGLAPNLPNDAKFFHDEGSASYHNGDISLAIADFDRAIRLDPNFEGAYIDRGIALYRMREFNRAFADIAQAMRIENSHRTVTAPVRKAPPLLNTN